MNVCVKGYLLYPITLSLSWTSILGGCGVLLNFHMIPATETKNVDRSVNTTLYLSIRSVM